VKNISSWAAVLVKIYNLTTKQYIFKLEHISCLFLGFEIISWHWQFKPNLVIVIYSAVGDRSHETWEWLVNEAAASENGVCLWHLNSHIPGHVNLLMRASHAAAVASFLPGHRYGAFAGADNTAGDAPRSHASGFIIRTQTARGERAYVNVCEQGNLISKWKNCRPRSPRAQTELVFFSPDGNVGVGVDHDNF
jgi:hypothetical protein